MRSVGHIMRLQIPQILGFIKVGRALELSLGGGVITKEEYDSAIAAISSRCGGEKVDVWLARGGTTVDSYTRLAFIKSF